MGPASHEEEAPTISYTWLVGIQITLSVWQKRLGILIYSSTLCGLLPSTLVMWSLCGCVVRWWTCHGVSDLSSFLLLWRRRQGRSPRAVSAFAPLVGSPLLRSDARTMEGEGVAYGSAPAAKTQSNSQARSLQLAHSGVRACACRGGAVAVFERPPLSLHQSAECYVQSLSWGGESRREPANFKLCLILFPVPPLKQYPQSLHLRNYCQCMRSV